MNYVCNVLEDVDEENKTVEAGLEMILRDYKGSFPVGKSIPNMDFDRFVELERARMYFDYEEHEQENILIDWGKLKDEITDIEMDFYAAIWPCFKAVLEDYNSGPKIYTAYAEKDDITFIMQETKINGGKQTKVEVIGFYYGEPNEAHTKEYAKNHNLVAILDD